MNNKIQEVMNIKSRASTLLFAIAILLFTACSHEPVRVACIGDSITYGSYLDKRELNSFPAKLGSMLGEGYDVRNFGESGATLLRRGSLPYWDTEAYTQALSFNPDLVFIKLGTNDSQLRNRTYLDEDFILNYKALIKSFNDLPSEPRVVLLIPVPAFTTDTTGICDATLTEKIIPNIRHIAYETGCEVINLYNPLIDSPELLPDNIHPNEEGAEIIAQRLNDYLSLKSKPVRKLLKKLPEESEEFNFYGFQGYAFDFMGKDAKVVVPKNAAPDGRWVWRARFWGHEPQTDIALLERGFYIVFCDVAEMFANDEALSIWDAFYRKLTRAGLNKKAVMEGMSRGGVYMYRWAVEYPRRVAAIYADAPVLDLKSWPGGKGEGPGYPSTWETFKIDFNLETEQEAMDFKGNPLDLTDEIAKAGFPMLHVVGDADRVVPVKENTAPFEEKIIAAGGSIRVIHKPGIDHHPHSLRNPQPIIDFIMEASK